jgi:peroxiredoxin family protein
VAGTLVILLRSADWESRYQAATLAVTAAALGDEVHVALFFGALRAWVDGHFDDGAPPQAQAVGSLRGMIEEGRAELGVRVVACDTAVRLAGLDPGKVVGVLDGIASLPDLWRLAQGGRALGL